MTDENEAAVGPYANLRRPIQAHAYQPEIDGDPSSGCSLDHDEVYAAFFKGSLRQTVPRHLLDLVPVLPQIAGSLLLCEKLGLDAANLAGISVCNLKKDRLITLENFSFR